MRLEFSGFVSRLVGWAPTTRLPPIWLVLSSSSPWCLHLTPPSTMLAFALPLATLVIGATAQVPMDTLK